MKLLDVYKTSVLRLKLRWKGKIFMSVARARKALRGEKTDCIPLFEMPAHRGFLLKLTGIDPYERTEEAVAEAVRRLDVDLLMGNMPTQVKPDGPGREHLYVDVHLEGTRWRHQGSTRPDIFAYDPAVDRTDAAARPEEKCRRDFQAAIDRDRVLVGETALPMGALFTTCIHYAAEDLRWEDFLVACLLEEERVSALLDRFQAVSAKLMRAWAATDIEVFLAHDDIAMNKGTVLSPDWLRQRLIPRYRELFHPLQERGIPVLFMTDGNFLAVAKDLNEIGADGFFLDTPHISLEDLAAVCGPDKIYFTGPAPSTMTVGTPGAVREEVRRLADIGRELPRFFFHMPGGFPLNTPVENIVTYFEACREYGKR